MDIISRSAHIVQQDFSDSIQSSLSDYINSKSNQSWNRFPSTYNNLVDIPESNSPFISDKSRQVYKSDLDMQQIESWLVKNKYMSAHRAVTSCGTTGIPATCKKDHTSAMSMSCGKMYCPSCSLKKSYIHQRKITRMLYRVTEPVKKGFVASYAVVTMSKKLQNWIMFGSRNEKEQKRRLKDIRGIVNKTPIEFYKNTKGSDSLEDASIASYHYCGDEYLTIERFLKEKNRSIKLKAFKKGYSEPTELFTRKCLDDLIEQGKVEYIVNTVVNDEDGTVKEEIKVLSPNADKFHLHLNMFFLHKDKGSAYIPSEQLPILKNMIGERIQEYLVEQSNNGVEVPDDLLNHDISINYHLEYLGREKLSQLKHRVGYSLRETIGSSRFVRMSSPKKHYILNALKGFRNVTYYGRLSTRNVGKYFEELGIEATKKESPTCSVCDNHLQINMNYNSKKKRMYCSRVGQGVIKEVEKEIETPSGNTITVTETATELTDDRLGYDENLYPLLEHFKPILDDSDNVTGYKWTQSGFKLNKDHLPEKLSNDMYKFIDLAILKKDFQWCSHVINCHLKFLQENIGNLKEVIDEVTLKVA